jgi:DNA polymerase III subunit epsilon
MTSWYLSDTVRSLDFEATGVDATTEHAVTAAIVDIHPDRRPEVIHWTLDPGVEVPTEAVEVHGYTRDRVLDLVGGPGRALRVGGGTSTSMTVDGALAEIAGLVAMAMHTEVPLVVANAPYDLTLLEAELGRHGIDSLTCRPSGIRGVVDPMVIDRAFDTYRKACYKTGPNGAACDPETGVHECSGCRGSRHHQCGGCGVTDRKLESLCKHYGVPLIGAHDAAADALAAARLSVRLGGLWRQIQRWKLGTLHEHQVTWRREQMDSLRSFFDKNGIEHDGCDPSWPLRRTPAATAVAS